MVEQMIGMRCTSAAQGGGEFVIYLGLIHSFQLYLKFRRSPIDPFEAFKFFTNLVQTRKPIIVWPYHLKSPSLLQSFYSAIFAISICS